MTRQTPSERVSVWDNPDHGTEWLPVPAGAVVLAIVAIVALVLAGVLS